MSSRHKPRQDWVPEDWEWCEADGSAWPNASGVSHCLSKYGRRWYIVDDADYDNLGDYHYWKGALKEPERIRGGPFTDPKIAIAAFILGIANGTYT